MPTDNSEATKLYSLELGSNCFRSKEHYLESFSWKTSRLILTLAAILSALQTVSGSSLALGTPYSSGDGLWAGSVGGHFVPQQTFWFFVYSASQKAPTDISWKIKAFSNTAGMIGSITHTAMNADGTAATDPLVFTITPRTQDVSTFNIQVNSPTSVVFTLDPTKSFSGIHNQDLTKCITQPGSNYLYSLVYQATNLITPKVKRLDLTNLGTTTLNIFSQTLGVSGYVYSQIWYDDSIYMVVGDSVAVLINKLDLTTLRIINDNQIGYISLKHPNTSNFFFSNKAATTSYGMKKKNIDQASNIVSDLQNTATTNTVTNLGRCIRYSVLLATVDLSSNVYIYDMHTLTLLQTVSVSSSFLSMSISMGASSGTSQAFGILQSSSNNFLVYSATLDFCNITAQNPCLACVSGRYLDTSTTDNRCLLPQDYPTNYGRNGTYYSPCFGDASSACMECASNYMTCTKCNNSMGYYLYATNGSCLTIPNIPNQFGLDTVNKVVVGCSDGNCLQCQSDYQTCTQCQANYYVKENTTAPCMQNVLDGWGKKQVNGTYYLAPCSTTYCRLCLNDYTTCTECAAGYYFKVGVVNTCYPNNIDGYGLNTSSVPNTLTPCAVTDCRVCEANYNTCTVCISPKILSSNTCITATGGLGWNGTAYVACTITNCYNCYGNYTICTQCDPQYYFRVGSNSTCELNNIMWTGLQRLSDGIDYLAGCSDSNCNWCTQQDIYHCDTCVTGYYTKIDDNTHCWNNTIPGMGLDLTYSPSKLGPCTKTHCTLCYSDRASCTDCAYPYFLVGGDCVQLPSGQGMSGGIQTACSIQYCGICWPLITDCTECQAAYYFEVGSNTTCYSNTRNYYGFNKQTDGTVRLSACTETNCLTCYSNSTFCEVCNSGYYMLEGTNTNCQSNTVSGRGLKTVGLVQYLATCAPANCVECYNDYTVCTKCAVSYYRKTDAPSAGCFVTGTSGYGLSVVGNETMLAPCSVSHCADCVSDSSVCSSCQAGYLFLEGSNTTCLMSTTTGYSQVSVNGVTVLRSCTVPNCGVCVLGSTTCQTCISPKILNPNTTTCVDNTAQGFGALTDSTTGYTTLVPCNDSKCLNCSVNQTICVQCQTGYVATTSGTCQVVTTYITLLNTPEVDTSGKFSLQFSQEVKTVPSREKLIYDVYISTTQTLDSSQYSVVLSLESSSVVTGQLTLSDTSYQVSYIVMRLVNTSEPVFYNDWSYFPPNRSITMKVTNKPIISTSVTQAALTAVVVGSSLAAGGAGAGGSGAATLIKVLDAVEYVLYLNGARIQKADSFVHIFSINILSILPNIFEVDEDKVECVSPESFEREGISCYILNNQGSELDTIAALAGAAIFFHFVKELSTKLEKSARFRVVGVVMKYIMMVPMAVLNLGTIVSLCEGSQIEIFRYSFLNLSRLDSNKYMLLGGLESVLLLGGYAILGWYYYKYVQLNLMNVESNPNEESGNSESNQEKHIKLHLLEEFFAGIKPRHSAASNLHLYNPLIAMGYCVLTQFVLVILAGKGIIQIWTLLVIDSIYALLWIKVWPYSSNWKNILSLITRICFCLIDAVFLLENYTSDKIPHAQREMYFGYSLIGLYILILTITLVPNFVEIGKLIGVTSKNLTKWIHSKLYPNNQALVLSKSNKQTMKLKKASIEQQEPIKVDYNGIKILEPKDHYKAGFWEGAKIKQPLFKKVDILKQTNLIPSKRLPPILGKVHPNLKFNLVSETKNPGDRATQSPTIKHRSSRTIDLDQKTIPNKPISPVSTQGHTSKKIGIRKNLKL